jgi:SAM-dependent methyltransferase
MVYKIKESLDAMAWPIYLARGCRPWTPGYYTAKKKAICAAIDGNIVSSGVELKTGYGRHIDERVVEYPWLFSQLPQNPGNVLDAGSALNHRFLIDRSPLKESQLTIMTLGPEKQCFWDRSISYVFGDLRQTFFRDAAFDIVISVSTIEHIGLDNTVLYTRDSSKNESDSLGFLAAVKEFKRILRPGGLCLITVPFGRQGVHGWYQVFDMDQVMKMVDTFHPSDCMIAYFGYFPSGWRRVTPSEIADATYFDIHAGKPFAKDLAAGARGVACIKMVV